MSEMTRPEQPLVEIREDIVTILAAVVMVGDADDHALKRHLIEHAPPIRARLHNCVPKPIHVPFERTEAAGGHGSTDLHHFAMLFAKPRNDPNGVLPGRREAAETVERLELFIGPMVIYHSLTPFKAKQPRATIARKLFAVEQ